MRVRSETLGATRWRCLSCTSNGGTRTSRAWKRERSGGSSGLPTYLGTGRPSAMTRKRSLTRTSFHASNSLWRHVAPSGDDYKAR